MAPGGFVRYCGITIYDQVGMCRVCSHFACSERTYRYARLSGGQIYRGHGERSNAILKLIWPAKLGLVEGFSEHTCLFPVSGADHIPYPQVISVPRSRRLPGPEVFPVPKSSRSRRLPGPEDFPILKTPAPKTPVPRTMYSYIQGYCGELHIC